MIAGCLVCVFFALGELSKTGRKGKTGMEKRAFVYIREP